MTTKRILVALATVLFLLALTGPALAHASYRGSDPADESTIGSAPSEIWADFTEKPDETSSHMEVYDPCGAQIDAGDTRGELTSNRLYISMSGGRSGTYRVDWFVLSSQDSHTTRGTFTFTVTSGKPCPGSGEDDDPAAPSKDRTGPGGGGGGNDPGAVSGGSDPQADQGGNSGGDQGQPDDSGKNNSGSNAEPKVEANGPAPVAIEPQPPEEPGVFEGIPMGGLVTGLVMAAAIGACGGLIYAGIMGYRRG